ncbi:hypothetical protein MAC_00965 [Metarhizium acridum CQMa 102]|uniref:Mitochondrial inner-membrane-bound regulator-domain-containing protein n=1 Tax=Metarhizium acridum (strain CQMa 102) TaxID=655827 RepID=E9DT83_METAQ|nr:uncharacterized protein MAC_00965 [Metarhizium acridum CQMa 102]EFY93182.1 hypothetical protein MAC_00965 [Metarhizium acridum CQMa 102]
MLARATRLPRICLVCRLGILRQVAAVPIRCPSSTTDRRLVRYASDFSPQSKERIEKLISGALDDIESHSKDSGVRKPRLNQKRQCQHRGDVHNEPAKRELKPGKASGLPDTGDINVTEKLNTSIENAPIRETSTSEEPSTRPQPMSMRGSQPCLETEELRDEFMYRHSLGMDALGKPVDAIIIKNPNRIRATKKGTTRSMKEAQHVNGTVAPFTWRDVIPQKEEVDESGFSKKISENIEEIRPKDTVIIRRKDFNKLVDYLVDGFTASQLKTYLDPANRNKIQGHAEAHLYSWLTEQSPWAAAEPLDLGLHRPKQQQAVAILTEVWKLEIQEHIEGIGRTVVWLKPDIFSLIANLQSGIIGRLSADFLDKSNKERITSRPEDHRLSIYARKSTVSTILARLDEIVQTIKSQTISVQRVNQENLETSVLMELEKITKTALRYNAITSTLDVSWLAETDVSNGKTEGPADIVLRLLIGRETSSQHADVQILPKTRPKKGVFLTHQRDKRGMAWRDKLRYWSRYVNPIGKSTEETQSPGFRDSIILEQPEASSLKENTEVTAVFGHILHTRQDTRKAYLAKSRRVLCPIIPHPAALTSITADTSAPSTQKTAIILNFAPESPPETSPPGTNPLVRLRLPINPFTDLSKFSFPDASVLEAVMPWQESDIMLPDNSVDVRLTQKRLVPLDASQHSLQAFCQASDFNLLQGRLRTPSRTSFAIPRFLTAQQSTPSTELVATPYMFMGLEIHQTIDMEWQSHTLRYSSTEAGQHGGQQQMLSLVAGPPGDQGSATTKQQLQSFLKLVEETACGAHFSWDEGYRLMSERSAEQFSWDMMDTEYAKQDLAIAEETKQGIGPDHVREGQEAGSPDQPQQDLDTVRMEIEVTDDSETIESLDETLRKTESTTDK